MPWVVTQATEASEKSWSRGPRQAETTFQEHSSSSSSRAGQSSYAPTHPLIQPCTHRSTDPAMHHPFTDPAMRSLMRLIQSCTHRSTDPAMHPPIHWPSHALTDAEHHAVGAAGGRGPQRGAEGAAVNEGQQQAVGSVLQLQQEELGLPGDLQRGRGGKMQIRLSGTVRLPRVVNRIPPRTLLCDLQGQFADLLPLDCVAP